MRSTENFQTDPAKWFYLKPFSLFVSSIANYLRSVTFEIRCLFLENLEAIHF